MEPGEEVPRFEHADGVPPFGVAPGWVADARGAPAPVGAPVPPSPGAPPSAAPRARADGRGTAIASLVVLGVGVLGAVTLIALFANAESEQADEGGDAWTLFFGFVFAFLWMGAMGVIATILAIIAMVRAQASKGSWPTVVIVAAALTVGPTVLMFAALLSRSVFGAY